MRVNIYAEELTDEVELTTKTVTDEKFGERKFYGLRFYLKSPPELHTDPEDDDRSAITLWVKWTGRLGTDPNPLYHLLGKMRAALDEEFG